VLNRRTLHVTLGPPIYLPRGRMQSQRKPNTFSLSVDLCKPSRAPVGRPRRDFFALRHNPFDLTPDPCFLHRTKQAHETLRVLNRAMVQRKGLIVLSGAPGTGKTILLNTALDRMKAHSAAGNRLRTAVIVNPTLSRDELLEAVLDEFEVPCASRSKQRRLELLLEMLLDVRRRDGNAILIVDEAQLLTLETLDELLSLLNLQTFHEKLLQVVLSGHQELEGRLEKFAISRKQPLVAARCKTTPLTLDETEDYIQHRLSVAGARNRSIFVREAVEAVYTHSGGIPRTVNLLCADALASADLRGVRQVSLQMIEEAAAKTILGVAKSSELHLHSSGSADFAIVDLPALPFNEEKARSPASQPPAVMPRRPRPSPWPSPSVGSKNRVLDNISSWVLCRTRWFDRWCSRNFTRKRCRILFTELALAAALLLGMTEALRYGEPWPHVVRAICGFAGLVLTALAAGLGAFLLMDGEPRGWPDRITSVQSLMKVSMGQLRGWLQGPWLKGSVPLCRWFPPISQVPGGSWTTRANVSAGRRFWQHPRPPAAVRGVARSLSLSSGQASPARRLVTVLKRRPPPKP
jgi:general secretion pathway protein A